MMQGNGLDLTASYQNPRASKVAGFITNSAEVGNIS